MGIGMVQSFANCSIQTADIWSTELHGAIVHVSMYFEYFLPKNMEEFFFIL